MGRASLPRLAACAALVGLALALYWPATAAWFYEDDLQWLAGTLTFEPAHLFDLSAQQHFFRPVISLYFWAATPLFDGSPVLFHWANHVLHAANALLVFLLAGALGFKPRFASLAALFFVSMPADIESALRAAASGDADSRRCRHGGGVSVPVRRGACAVGVSRPDAAGRRQALSARPSISASPGRRPRGRASRRCARRPSGRARH